MSTAPDILSALDKDAFEYFRAEIRRRSGISIGDQKQEMITGRLRKRLVALKLPSFEAYADYLRSLAEGDEEWEIFTNCLTTNKTDFFREPEHFDILTGEILEAWRNTEARERKKKGESSEFRVWCAASSTGEEPYTLSMVLQRAARSRPFAYSILATDIDSQVLSRAKSGVYPISKLSEIPKEYHKDSVAVGTGEISQWMKIKAALRPALQFEHCNLVKTPYNRPHAYDVIFCRNVLIYFTPDTIEAVVKGLYEAAKPGAYLVIGHSESLHNITTDWQYVKPSVYRKKG